MCQKFLDVREHYKKLYPQEIKKLIPMWKKQLTQTEITLD
jgi:hypothetical protein